MSFVLGFQKGLQVGHFQQFHEISETNGGLAVQLTTSSNLLVRASSAREKTPPTIEYLKALSTIIYLNPRDHVNAPILCCSIFFPTQVLAWKAMETNVGRSVQNSVENHPILGLSKLFCICLIIFAADKTYIFSIQKIRHC